MAPILNLISSHQPLAVQTLVLLSRSEQFMKNVHLICCTKCTHSYNAVAKYLKITEHCTYLQIYDKLARLSNLEICYSWFLISRITFWNPLVTPVSPHI